jgi:hypothetical protein
LEVNANESTMSQKLWGIAKQMLRENL